jgi:hypothetical protein
VSVTVAVQVVCWPSDTAEGEQETLVEVGFTASNTYATPAMGAPPTIVEPEIPTALPRALPLEPSEAVSSAA